MKAETLKLVYFAYCHSIMLCEIILGGFQQQKIILHPEENH
jgi:hypothetical protein